jgi:sulfide:quinone oxidoreductase
MDRPTSEGGTTAGVEHHVVLVVGGGNGGVSLAARLLRDGAPDVAVLSEQPVHVYRPLLNYVGGGEARMSSVERSMRQVLPDGCTWIPDAATAVDPASATVRTSGGRTLRYATLVLAPGLTEDWDATAGLEAAYADGWAASTYVTAAAPRVWPALSALRAGTVVFSVPPEPAPCAPTALKPLFLACDHWRRTGVLGDLDVRLVLPGASALGLERADAVLERHLASYGVRVSREAVVTAVDHRARTVTVSGSDGQDVVTDVALAHVVPRYRAPSFIAESGLAVDPAPGLVDIDAATLRHRRHPAVWALGDAAAVGTRPSGGALRPQVDVLARNLAAVRSGTALASYDGYTVAPVTVGRRRLLLAEVDRRGAPRPSVPVVDLLKPRWTTWFADRYVLPLLYFRRILRGKV